MLKIGDLEAMQHIKIFMISGTEHLKFQKQNNTRMCGKEKAVCTYIFGWFFATNYQGKKKEYNVADSGDHICQALFYYKNSIKFSMFFNKIKHHI